MHTMANGPIVNRVDLGGWQNFVANKSSLMHIKFQAILTPDNTYCSPYSDELAMLHLLKNYGFFEKLSLGHPLRNILGNGPKDGWFDIIDTEYGSPCFFPWKKTIGGSSQEARANKITFPTKCCVHAYVSIDECKTQIKDTIIKTSPGFVKQNDPKTNEAIVYPFQELSCPLEVSLLDERTPDMSLAQQFESVSVSASRLVGKFSMLSIFYTTY